MKTSAVSALAAALIGLAGHSASAQGPPPPPISPTYSSTVVTIDTRPDVKVTYVATRRVGPFVNPHPVALVLLAGGNGLLQIAPNGSIQSSLKLNFLIRSRPNFLLSGAALVVAVDAPSDRPQGLDGEFRLSLEHALDLAGVIGKLKTDTGLTVWLVGTSTGTMSVVNAAARKLAPTAAGFVLTSSQTKLVPGLCEKTVFDANPPLGAITAPVFMVAHMQDACPCSPPFGMYGAKTVIDALTGTSKKKLEFFKGGKTPISGVCGARHYHGFYGIETSVTKAIVNWIKPLLP
jgi:pimeloyl-ACP methyl ester carboxylesterase